MSVVFLECADFHKEFPTLSDWPIETSATSGACCKDCHTKPENRIYIQPLEEGEGERNADWFLCVEAKVCCGLYNFVRALPRDWWVKKSAELGVTRRDDRGYIYPSSPQKNTEREHAKKAAPVSFVKEKVKRIFQKQQEDEEAGGLSGWRK